MSRVTKNFRLARQAALHGDDKGIRRQYRLGAVGLRSDGTTVTSNNLPCQSPNKHAHAEARLCRKLDWDSEVFVVRITMTGGLTNARPCDNCMHAMRLRGVKRIYYSINENEHGVIKL